MGLPAAVAANFQALQAVCQIPKRRNRLEKRRVSIYHQLEGLPKLLGLGILIRVELERQADWATVIEVLHETHYYEIVLGGITC